MEIVDKKLSHISVEELIVWSEMFAGAALLAKATSDACGIR